MRISLIGVCIFLGSCITTVVSPTPTQIPLTPTLSTDVYQEWHTLAPGLEFRIFVPDSNAFRQFWALRIDPAYYSFRVHYRPDEPMYVGQWQDMLPGSVALVNANLFHLDFTVTGLLVADGQIYGNSYQGFGGMFQVQGGLTRVKPLTLEPYLGEVVEQAVQGFPMLVVNGEVAYTSLQDRATRRTVIAQDSSGRIILMATPLVGMRLADFATYLTIADMDLVNALNLDGGGSTMMLVQPNYLLPSVDRVPAVLAVYPR